MAVHKQPYNQVCRRKIQCAVVKVKVASLLPCRAQQTQHNSIGNEVTVEIGKINSDRKKEEPLNVTI